MRIDLKLKDQTDLTDLLATFPRLQRVAIYQQIKNDPAIQGFVLYSTLMIGSPIQTAALPFGPNCHTLKKVEDAGEGIAISGTSPTNPLYPVKYAFIPDSFPRRALDEMIQHETTQGLNELPRLWVGRKRDTGVRMGDRLRNPENGADLIILTFGGKGVNDIDYSRVLVCPATVYSEDMETDPASKDYGYRKGHQYWEWLELREAFERGYVLLVTADNSLYALLVAERKEEKGID